MPITQTITALPTAPNSSDPSTFESRADAFVAALPGLVTEVNTWADQVDALAVTVNADAASALASKNAAETAETNAELAETNAEAAQAAAEVAAAAATNAANVQGTSTSSIAIPTSETGTRTFVYVESSRAVAVGMFILAAVTASPGTNWILLQVTSWNSGTRTLVGNVITYAGSGTYSAWTLSLTGPRGRAGADAVLVSPFTARSGTVSLVYADNGNGSNLTSATVTPDTPSTLTNGWTHFLRATSGTSTVVATFDDGATSKVLAQGQQAILSSNGTTMQLDLLGSGSKTFGVLGTAQVVATAASSNDIAICQLSSTRALVLYRNASNFPQVALVDQTGAKVSGHTPIQIEATTAANTMQILKISSTTAIAVWGNSSGARAVHLTVSGTTVTAGTVIAATSESCTAIGICMLTSTKFVIGYNKVPTDSLAAKTITLSGTTLTANSEYTLITSLGVSNAIRLCTMSATQALLVFSAASVGATTRGLVLTEASNVLTFPTSSIVLAETGSANPTGQGDIVALTSTKAVVVSGATTGNTGFGNAFIVEYGGTGTTATMQPGRSTILAAGSSIIGHRIALLSQMTVLHVTRPEGVTGIFIEALTITGDGLLQGAALSIARSLGQYDLCIMDGTTVLVAYVDTNNSSYPTVRPVALGGIS